MTGARDVVDAPVWRFLDGPVIEADCLEALRWLPSESVDAVVTDPPYGLSREPDPVEVLTHWLAGDDYHHRGGGFMGNSWDSFVPGPAVWREALRVLKPGGHLAAFGGPRTYDLLAIAIRLAGFEIRDTLMWLFGSGFPKSLDVSKAIDKRRDDEAEVRVVCRWLRARIDASAESVRSIAERFGFHPRMVEHWAARDSDSQPTLPTLEQWDALRELLGFNDEMDAEVLRLNLRKGEPGEAWAERPVTGAVAEWENRQNYALTSRDGLRRDVAHLPEARAWEGWGTALKPAYEPIVLARKPLAGTVAETVLAHGTGAIHIAACRLDGRERGATYGELSASADFDARVGRWPANVLLDEAAAEMLDAQTGELVSGKMMPTHTTAGDARQVYGRDAAGGFTTMETYGDRGGASRFFYCAKASRGERDAGLDGFPLGDLRWSNGEQSPGTFQSDGTDRAARNHHPTVKPIELMRWLLRLLTPPGGIVLDLFAGSGSTVCAGAIERIDVIGIEREPAYVAIARARAAWWSEHPEGLPVEACVQAARRRRARTEEGQFSMFDSEPAERAA